MYTYFWGVAASSYGTIRKIVFLVTDMHVMRMKPVGTLTFSILKRILKLHIIFKDHSI